MKQWTALLLVLLAGCGGGNVAPLQVPEASPEVREFRRAAVELLRRDELDLERVTIQFVLIAHGLKGTADSKPDLSMPEAEARAAEVYRYALRGDDFDRLVQVHSYPSLIPGQRPGMLTLLRDELPPMQGPSTFRRDQQETSVWKAAWRLEPGEIGAVEKHHKDSNSGFYVLRRLTTEDERRDDPANFEPASDAVAAMRADARALMDRDEHNAERVKVQHFLIARYMSDRAGRHGILDPSEAEERAAELYLRARAGEDFDALVREYSYDAVEGDPPGVYEMIAKDADLPGTRRGGMAPAFGDAGWRLEVGEVGVILYDRARSWYGYHIIKRLE
jgi:hypothetical protein